MEATNGSNTPIAAHPTAQAGQLSVVGSRLREPIEITVACTYYIVDREFSDDDKLPVGYPCRNTEILILNEQNQLRFNAAVKIESTTHFFSSDQFMDAILQKLDGEWSDRGALAKAGHKQTGGAGLY